MKTNALLLSSLLFASLLLAPSVGAKDEPRKASFPESWEGAWKGPCVVVRNGKTAMEFPMELHVEAIAGEEDEPGGGGGPRWTWKIVYGEGDKRQVRPYELWPIDPKVGHYRVDEKNGILIESYFENDVLHSRFRVMQSVIEATYARTGDTMTVTLTTFGAESAKDSGGAGNVPKVESYALRAVQRGTLKRAR